MPSQKQLAALKYLISGSLIKNDLIKRIFWLLIDQSQNGTQEVCLTLRENVSGFKKREIHYAAHAVREMRTRRCGVNVDEMCIATGLDFHFDVHYGHRKKNGCLNTFGMFVGFGKLAPGHENDTPQPLRYTFFFTKKPYSKVAKEIKISKIELEKINLENSGLYDSLL